MNRCTSNQPTTGYISDKGGYSWCVRRSSIRRVVVLGPRFPTFRHLFCADTPQRYLSGASWRALPKDRTALPTQSSASLFAGPLYHMHRELRVGASPDIRLGMSLVTLACCGLVFCPEQSISAPFQQVDARIRRFCGHLHPDIERHPVFRISLPSSSYRVRGGSANDPSYGRR